MSPSIEIRWAASILPVGSGDAGGWKLHPSCHLEDSEFCLAFSRPPHLSYHVMLRTIFVGTVLRTVMMKP